MANISAHVAVATAVLGYDLFQNEVEARQPYARKIIATGLVGSAAIGDTEVEFRVGGKPVGKYTNTTAGVSSTNPGSVKADVDLKRADIFVPANQLLQAIVTDAPATNDVRCEAHFGRPATTAKRPYSRRPSGYTARRPATRRPTTGMY